MVNIKVKRPPPAPPAEVTLQLDSDTATAIYDILGHVGGDPKRTRRGLMEALYNELRLAMPELAEREVNDLKPEAGGLYFKEIK